MAAAGDTGFYRFRSLKRKSRAERPLPESVKSVKDLLPIYPIPVFFFTDSGLKRHRASRNPLKNKTVKTLQSPDFRG